jgi:GAF domain-containing protein
MNNVRRFDESRRLAALRAYRILDTGPDRAYDDIVRLATFASGAPMATISFVDETRQWFKSRIGIEALEAPRDSSFCTYTILNEHPLIITDAAKDPRFVNNPFVQGSPHIRFYAGFPVITPEGHALGSLSAISHHPQRLTWRQYEALGDLTRRLVALLELRRNSLELARALEFGEALTGQLTVCAWCQRIRNRDGSWREPGDSVRNQVETTISHGICSDCFAQQVSHARSV